MNTRSRSLTVKRSETVKEYGTARCTETSFFNNKTEGKTKN